MEYRIEKDTMGEVKVPADKYWGAQTQRSLQNFAIGTETMPPELIRAFAILKRSCAIVNNKLGKLHDEKAEAIVKAADEIIEGKHDDQFPLKIWQTGSGTQTNMNLNEVIANRGNEWLQEKGSGQKLHPNDDVNMGQSSNDTFPTAMHIAATEYVQNQLIPEIENFRNTLQQKAEENMDLVKIGRTHLQDATPLTLGQEISGWVHMLDRSLEFIKESSDKMKALAIGGTAVGTGINTHPEFGAMVAEEISKFTGIDFYSSVINFML